MEGPGTGDPRSRLSIPKTNVSAAGTSFVGRESALRNLTEELRRARLSTLVGPPGAGKTRLATEFVTRHGGAFLADGAGGAWFCDLSEAFGLDDVFRKVAEVLDVSIADDRTQNEVARRLASVLASRGQTLLILDNLEQLLPAALPVIEYWLDRAPELTILATSRVRLGVTGEATVEISGLDLGGRDAEAVRLFVDRACLARRDFAPSDDELAVIAELVARLDGLPLAIELAGARMGVLGPKQLLERLGKSLDLLRGGKGRASTLRATLDWSWNLLPSEERLALAQASVFHGGFSLEAAEAVIEPGGRDLLDVLESLRRSSLLRSYALPELPGEVRFGLLEIVRAYADERLSELDPAGAAKSRHARHFVAVAERWAGEVERPNGPEFLRRLAAELPNLGAVHRRALAKGEPTTPDFEDALAVVLALEHVFYMRGPTAPCLEMLDAVFEHELDGVDQRLVALALKARGRALRDLGYAEESLEALARAREVALAIGDVATDARILGHVGYSQQLLGKTEDALAAFEQARRAAAGAGDRRSEGMLAASIASALLTLGRVDEAALVLEEALAVDEEVGNRYAAAAALALRGELERTRGRFEAARADLEAALEGYREFGERRHEGIALTDLGILYQEQQRFDDARRCLERALVHHREFGSRMFQANARAALADLDREQGRLGEARRGYEAALKSARELEDPALEARLLAGLAGTHAALGRVEIAEATLAEARAAARSAGDPAASRLAELATGLCELARSARGPSRDEAEAAARARLERALGAGPVGTRPAAERVALRLLEQTLAAGAPLERREETPTVPRAPGEIGRYELLLEVASGGMATVYVGRQRGAGGFERVVAIKRMHRHLSSLPEFTAAFLNEARIASAIRHPNVVSVHDVAETGREHLLVMDYVDGTSLFELGATARARSLAIPRGIALYVASQALRGLHAAHEQTDLEGNPLGIVHRDATPHNILVGADGSVRITDFGIAKIRQQNEKNEGSAKGKFRYMAPEQLASGDVDRRVDVFALGVVTWELLTGRRLFDHDSDSDVVAALSAGQFEPPSRVEPAVPADLDAIVMRALAPAREARHATALELAEALERWASDHDERASEPELGRLVGELVGDALSDRRRRLSEALANAKTADAAPSLPPPPASVRVGAGSLVISVGSSGRWFALPGAERVSLQRRRALRLILKALLAHRLDAPGKALPQPALLEAGWPGEKVKHEAGTLRVYNALSTLRKLGLRDVLLSRDDGYLLDPKVEFRREQELDGS